MINGLLNIFALSQLISISLTQMIFALLLVTFIFNLAKKEYDFNCSTLFKLFLLFFIWHIIATVFNYANFDSNKLFVKQIIGWWHYLIIFTVCYLASKFNINILKTINYLIIGNILASLYAIYQVLFHIQARGTGFYNHWLTFGNALSLALVLNVIILITKKYSNRKEMILYLISLVVGIAGLLSSLSRGPILYFFITVCLIIIFTYRLKGLLFGIFIIIGFSSLIYFNTTLHNRFSDFFNGSWKVSTSSFGTRVVLWKTSIEIIKDNPILGIGNDIRKEFNKRINIKVISKAHSHNSYLNLAVYKGIPAVIILMIIFGYLMVRFSNSNDIFVRLSGIGVLLNFMLEGLSENNFTDSEVLMLFCFIIGLLYSKLLLTTGKNNVSKQS